jgi:hypothetical protein
MTMLSLSTSEGEVKRSRGLSIFTIRKTRGQERDQRKSGTDRESFGREALSSQETSTPTAINGTQHAKCSELILSGKT